MESYRVLNRLGKGAQGSVYLVEHRTDGYKYVIKKIECKDEGGANESFREAMVLRNLDYPSICIYKEFFVMWDAEDSAINFCIVMDYYGHGDLKAAVMAKQETGETFSEDILKIWLGQIISAVVHINQFGIIHRDLKPSNIFLQDQLNVRIGDFGVATVMKDARSHTRSVIGTSHYIAPESLEGQFSAQSDIWSLGVIFLELMKCDCGSSDGTECDKTGDALRFQVDELSEKYSDELLSAVKQMLTVDPSMRPTAQELAEENNFVRFCVDIVDCAKIDKQKTKLSAGLPPPQPTSRDAATLVAYVKAVQYDEERILAALVSLLDVLKGEASEFSRENKVLITDVMINNSEDVAVLTVACGVLNVLITTALPDDVFYSKVVLSMIISAMNVHGEVVEFMKKACSFLSACAEEEDCGLLIGELDGIKYILASLSSFLSDRELVAVACEALWNLAVYEKNAVILTSLNGIKIICEALHLHMDSVEVVEPAAATLLSLAMEEENALYIHELNTMTLLMQAIGKHRTSAKVVKNACFALATFAEIDEESAFNILKGYMSQSSDMSGLSVILSAYDCHKDNAEVVEAIATLILEISAYNEIKLEMEYFKVGATLLTEVHKRFKENKDIIAPCEAAMSNLGIQLTQTAPKS